MLRSTLLASLTLCCLGSSAAVDRPEQIELGRSVGGLPVVARVWGDGADTALIIASIHGSEPAGTPLVERFERWIAERPEQLAGRRLVVVPVANPDGYAKGERLNANGIDLNRNFPADNRTEHRRHGPTALSEPESAALMRLLRMHPPQRVLSIHQPLKCVDYDGPAQQLAEAISRGIDGRLPVERVGSRPGSLGSYVGETLGVPIITLELPKHAEDNPEKLWSDYRGALEAFVRGEAT